MIKIEYQAGFCEPVSREKGIKEAIIKINEARIYGYGHVMSGGICQISPAETEIFSMACYEKDGIRDEKLFICRIYGTQNELMEIAAKL